MWIDWRRHWRTSAAGVVTFLILMAYEVHTMYADGHPFNVWIFLVAVANLYGKLTAADARPRW